LNEAGDQPKPKHDPLAAFKERNFVVYLGSQALARVGSSMLEGIILWQVYDISKSYFLLGALGLARFVPALLLTVIGGAVADTYNRRRIIMIAQLVPIACAAVLALASLGDWITLELIFGLILCVGFSSSFEGPANNALLPSLVRPETFSNAVNVWSAAQNVTATSGPLLAGFFIDLAGYGTGYFTVAGLMATSIFLLPLLDYKQTTPARRVSIEMIREGLSFVRHSQVLLAAMTLDMFAVIFGGAKALLPVYASDILDVGARGFGFLGAAFEVGAFSMSALLVFMPPVRRTGRALLWTVVAFGIGTMAFGLSRSFAVSLVIYGLIGAADQLSVVMRRTTIQLATPDALRGRVNAVGSVFINASNHVGGLESGLVASVSNPTFAVVSGGVGTLISVAMIAWRMPLLHAYRTPGAVTEVEEAAEAPDTGLPTVADESGRDATTPARGA
jgi:MFS family permease